MSQKSVAKIKVDGISQIAIAVNNIEEVAENFWKIMGIGPWMIFDWDPPPGLRPQIPRPANGSA